MTEYMADTHPLLWDLFVPKRLGRTAFAIFREVDRGNARLYVPAIVVSEMLMVIEKGRIHNVTMQDLLDEIDGTQPKSRIVAAATRDSGRQPNAYCHPGHFRSPDRGRGVTTGFAFNHSRFRHHEFRLSQRCLGLNERYSSFTFTHHLWPRKNHNSFAV
jgi:hypothetical protein